MRMCVCLCVCVKRWCAINTLKLCMCVCYEDNPRVYMCGVCVCVSVCVCMCVCVCVGCVCVKRWVRGGVCLERGRGIMGGSLFFFILFPTMLLIF